MIGKINRWLKINLWLGKPNCASWRRSPEQNECPVYCIGRACIQSVGHLWWKNLAVTIRECTLGYTSINLGVPLVHSIDMVISHAKRKETKRSPRTRRCQKGMHDRKLISDIIPGDVLLETICFTPMVTGKKGAWLTVVVSERRHEPDYYNRSCNGYKKKDELQQCLAGRL